MLRPLCGKSHVVRTSVAQEELMFVKLGRRISTFHVCCAMLKNSCDNPHHIPGLNRSMFHVFMCHGLSTVILLIVFIPSCQTLADNPRKPRLLNKQCAHTPTGLLRLDPTRHQLGLSDAPPRHDATRDRSRRFINLTRHRDCPIRQSVLICQPACSTVVVEERITNPVLQLCPFPPQHQTPNDALVPALRNAAQR